MTETSGHALIGSISQDDGSTGVKPDNIIRSNWTINIVD